MKTSTQMALIVGLACAASGIHWAAQGRPSGDPMEEIARIPLREGEIEAAALLAMDPASVLIIDARRVDEWQADGIDGAVSITPLSDEDLVLQLERHADALFGASLIAVYCGDIHCALSHELAERLKRDHAALLGGEIKVVHGGLPALKAAGAKGRSGS
ncbi:MAG: rhodanese-like domain-containing protein [Akkermansiaceae bacterium]|nr:rhodanese-like domain-containing protein [Akkermansiaceae bacterium]